MLQRCYGDVTDSQQTSLGSAAGAEEAQVAATSTVAARDHACLKVPRLVGPARFKALSIRIASWRQASIIIVLPVQN